MHLSTWLMVLVAGSLVACEKPNPARPAAPTVSAKSPGTASASAEQVAKEARGGVDCPAPIKSQRPSGAPVDDVIGARPGMTYEEAFNVVLCTHAFLVPQLDPTRGFTIQSYGQKLRQGFGARSAAPRVERTAKRVSADSLDDMLARGGNAVREDLQPGQAKWFVGTLGLPGQERVINVAREERFEAGANPTVSSVEKALLDKYGKPTKQQNTTSAQRYLTWSYDPAGRLVSEGSPLFNRCSGNASPDGGVRLSPDCGIVVMAIVFPLRDNPDLAGSLQVGVVNQAGSYELLGATEKALQAAEQQRRATQTEQAAKNATAPRL